jgi:hypothetical protein
MFGDKLDGSFEVSFFSFTFQALEDGLDEYFRGTILAFTPKSCPEVGGNLSPLFLTGRIGCPLSLAAFAECLLF